MNYTKNERIKSFSSSNSIEEFIKKVLSFDLKLIQLKGNNVLL